MIFDLIEAEGAPLDVRGWSSGDDWAILYETREDRATRRLTRTSRRSTGERRTRPVIAALAKFTRCARSRLGMSCSGSMMRASASRSPIDLGRTPWRRDGRHSSQSVTAVEGPACSFAEVTRSSRARPVSPTLRRAAASAAPRRAKGRLYCACFRNAVFVSGHSLHEFSLSSDCSEIRKAPVCSSHLSTVASEPMPNAVVAIRPQRFPLSSFTLQVGHPCSAMTPLRKHANSWPDNPLRAVGRGLRRGIRRSGRCHT